MKDNSRVRQLLSGPIASISTPFKRDGSIDYPALRNIVEFVIAANSGTLLLTWGDSLYSILTDSEITEVTRVVVEQNAGRKLVVAAGNWWTGESVRFAKYCKEIGVDMYMPLPPNWANSCTADTLVEHFAQVANVMPVMLVTALGPGVSVPLSVVKTLLERKANIVAVKDDICGAYGRRLASMVKGQWLFLSGGRKENHMDALLYGVDAYLSIYMRFKPEIAHRYWSAVQAGNQDEAIAVINMYDIPFMDFVGTIGADFDAVIHASMELFGVAERWRRLPYNSLTDEQMGKLNDFFRTLGLL
ncbi:dihydrodipicolinate synthase family protein [Paenibacillus eucommiae]|uniref:Dihydrodipicolinate synthase/N-acetylneuraminate lyase n=1 Tax=Paenibacillus eucommiae TaxID=1355755 RepID=A0ABS4JAL4_9BACL|nr:dihydrodipicolinate synthase family protein [Paenibacillus eucommiae]MBP1996286.1 dihydrodipicolinate synthase/N-acetylneuraminate lyase [Paenibacillus eucommiae]